MPKGAGDNATQEPLVTTGDEAESTTTGAENGSDSSANADDKDSAESFDAAAAYREIMGDAGDNAEKEPDDEDGDAAKEDKAGEEDKGGKDPSEKEPDKKADGDGNADEITLIKLEDLELPKLDPELAKNPAVLKRVQEFESGVKKRVDQVNAQLEEAKTLRASNSETADKLSYLLDWNELLSDPATAHRGLAVAIDHLSSQHGIDAEDLMEKATEALAEWREQGKPGKAKAKTDDAPHVNPDYEGWEDDELDPDVKAQRKELLDREAKRGRGGSVGDENAGLRQQVSQLAKIVTTLVEEQKGTAAEREADKELTESAPTIKKLIRSTEHGFEVTDEQIRGARKELPDIWKKDKPRAVRMYLADELKAHTAEVVAKQTQRAPELTKGATRTGKTVKDPEEYSAADALAEVREEDE